MCFICFGVAASIAAKKLTVPAAVTGGLLGAAIFAGAGWAGIALMGTFFLLGTSASGWEKGLKQDAGLAQENDGRRTVGQVLANGGTGGVLGILAVLFPQQKDAFLLLMAAAFSSAAADTVSSELGSVYGRKFYDVLTLKKGRRGDDGVISAEGLLFGIGGSLAVAVVYAVSRKWNFDCCLIVMAGTVGNLADSYLGATVERKGVMGNDAVNFLNTVVAALMMLALR